MEIIKEQSAMLSNSEVYSFLKELQEKRKKIRHQKNNLATITYEAIQYLEQNTSIVENDVIPLFLKAIEPFSLTKAEKLQLLNHRPTTLVEIQLLIEESEERLTEEQMEEILQIVDRTLPGGKDEAQDDHSSDMPDEET